jgi:hypothetical protein
MRRTTTISGVLAIWLALLVALASHALAQQVTCANFATQAEAQTYYDQHRDQTQLDGDGDGQACEGLPGAAAATPAATVAPASTPATIPNNGAETGVMALSGLSLVEAGYGLTLVARRYGVKRRAIPMYLLRKLVSAGQSGGSTVALGDDLYLVHESALHATTEDRYHFVDLADDGPLELVLEEGDDPDEPFRPATASSTPHLNLYASLAKGDKVAEVEAAPDEEASDPWDDDFAWRV